MTAATYTKRMADAPAFLALKLDTAEPIELRDFLGAFASIGNQVERFIAERQPGVKVDTQTYVREVRNGCVEADLIVGVAFAGMLAMDHALILEEFVNRWGARISALVSGDKSSQPDNKRDLKDFADALQAIATDPNASHKLQVATFEDGKRKIKTEFSFNNAEARSGLQSIEDRRAELDQTEGADHKRVLMIFTRSDVKDATLNKRSADRVRIEEVADRSLAVMYSSSMAEERIRHEVRDGEENIYKKGFVVDVNVRHAPNGKPIMYAVTNLHEVIELPDDD